MSSSSSVITFRLLAVQRKFDGTNMRSAEYLIDALLRHTNWNNSTSTYVSYIHLLSSRNLAGDPKYGRFYKGDATKRNMRNEIRNFFNRPVAGENLSRSVRILYYIGHGNDGELKLDQNYTYSELKQDLTSGGLGNNNCTLIILDTCHSGSAIDDGKCGGTLNRTGWVVLSACNRSESAWGWLWCSSSFRAYPGYWGIFTGYNNTQYKNGTTLPVGLIGAMNGGASDTNNDGWLSANELFSFAKTSTSQYVSQDDELVNKKSERHQNPKGYYGVVGGKVPVIPCWYYWVEPPIPVVTWPGNGKPGCLKLSASPSASWWGRYRHNAAGTGYASCNGPTSNNLLYYRDLGPIISSTAVVKGMAFIATHNGENSTFYALDMKNGEIIWKYPPVGYLPAPVSSSPAVADGVAFFGTETPDGRLYALDIYTGTPRWVSIPLGGGTEGISSPAVIDNRVFVGTLDGFFYCLNATNGEILWEQPVGAPILSSPAVADGMVFFGTEAPSNRLYALDEFTGDFIWNFSDGAPIHGSPAVADGLVFIGTLSGAFYAISETDGAIVWSYVTSSPIYSSPAVNSLKHLVIIGAEYSVICLDELTGAWIWDFPTSGQIVYSSPSIASNGLVYIGTHDNRVYCINETTGTEVWNFTTDGIIDSSPAISAEHLFIGSSDGKIYCLGIDWPDIGIENCWPSKQFIQYCEKTITINCIVKNLGSTTETFNLKCYLTPIHSDPAIYGKPSKMVLSKSITLKPGESTKANVTLNVNDLISTSHIWKLWADISVVMYEVKMKDNQYTFGAIYITGGGNFFKHHPLPY